MTPRDLCLHGLAIKRHASIAAVADLIGMAEPAVEAIVRTGVAAGRVLEIRGGFTLTPLARVALAARYGAIFGGVREEATFRAAYDRFEAINLGLKQVITDWQTLEIRGERVANDHSNAAYDDRVIDRLADIHERLEPVMRDLSEVLPRLDIYRQKLQAALEKAEDGAIEWVSDVRRESYHTVWFELHEDLLRIMGTVREE